MRTLLEKSFRAAVAAADPLKILPAHLPRPPRGRTFVAAAGKAAASMALAVERHWPRGAPLEGLAITRYAHGLPTERIRVIEAGHPVPNASCSKKCARWGPTTSCWYSSPAEARACFRYLQQA